MKRSPLSTQLTAAVSLLLPLWLIGFCSPASAQSNEDKLRDLLRQTTLQLRALQDENAQLKSREQALRQQLSATAAAPAAATKPPPDSADLEQRVREAVDKELAGRVAKAAAREAAVRSEYEAKLAAAQADSARYRQSLEGAAQAARAQEEVATQLRAQLQSAETRGQSANAALQSCTQKNAELVAIGRDLLDRFEHKTVWQAMKDTEPVTGLARVRLETIAQEIHGRIEDNAVPAAASAPAP